MACVIDEGDCSIRYIALPATVRAMTVRDGDGHYNIYINTQLSAEQQQDALLHEMQHLLRDDFDSARTFEQAEAYRAADAPPPPKKGPSPIVREVAVPRIDTLGGLLRFVASLSAGKPGRQPPARRVNLDITADEKRK
ncbi:MAG: hypothetical protein KHX46_06180 [Clostridiales bacterium]|nr:hypothetical protein [Clostridiales bacterium]